MSLTFSTKYFGVHLSFSTAPRVREYKIIYNSSFKHPPRWRTGVVNCGMARVSWRIGERE
jgi:hypothetical protein